MRRQGRHGAESVKKVARRLPPHFLLDNKFLDVRSEKTHKSHRWISLAEARIAQIDTPKMNGQVGRNEVTEPRQMAHETRHDALTSALPCGNAENTHRAVYNSTRILIVVTRVKSWGSQNIWKHQCARNGNSFLIATTNFDGTHQWKIVDRR